MFFIRFCFLSLPCFYLFYLFRLFSSLSIWFSSSVSICFTCWCCNSSTKSYTPRSIPSPLGQSFLQGKKAKHRAGFLRNSITGSAWLRSTAFRNHRSCCTALHLFTCSDIPIRETDDMRRDRLSGDEHFACFEFASWLYVSDETTKPTRHRL